MFLRSPMVVSLAGKLPRRTPPGHHQRMAVLRVPSIFFFLRLILGPLFCSSLATLFGRPLLSHRGFRAVPLAPGSGPETDSPGGAHLSAAHLFAHVEVPTPSRTSIFCMFALRFLY